MGRAFRKAVTIRGIAVPHRRFTRWAALYFVGYVALPVLGAAALLDVAFYHLFAGLFDSCYALLCLFR